MSDIETTDSCAATLLRGRVHYYKGIRFEVGVPKAVSFDLAQELEDQTDDVTDPDGEVIYKKKFRVTRPKVVVTPPKHPKIRKADTSAISRAQDASIDEDELEDDAPRKGVKPRRVARV